MKSENNLLRNCFNVFYDGNKRFLNILKQFAKSQEYKKEKV